MKDLLYELRIEDDTDEVFAISLVESPAIESDFVYFDKEVVQFAKVDSEQRMVLGPILIPDKKILRVDGEGNPYHVFFTKDTVKKLAQNYLMKKYTDKATIEHDKSINGKVHLVESWVKDGKLDKSNNYGLSLPEGTWVGMFKITDDKVWNDYVKEGKVKGFSIEGLFTHALVKASKIDLEKDVEDLNENEVKILLGQIKALIRKDNRFKSKERIEFESYSDYPDGVKNNAKRALEWADKNGWGSCGTPVGKQRANQLAKGEPISVDTIRRMYSFVSRHEKDLEVSKSYSDGCGKLMMDAWGGLAGGRWAKSKLRELGLITEAKEGVPHYTADGKLYEGPTHKDASGRLMTGEVHTEDSRFLYHEEQFAQIGPRGGIKESPKAPKSDTKNPDPQGEGTAKGKASSTRGAKVTEEQEKTLQNKAKEFNEKESNTKYGKANVGALKSVFQRGLGAYVGSHSPNVRSAEQWAYARVNAWLYLLKNGRPENPKYTGDFDLLPKGHPKADTKMESQPSVTSSYPGEVASGSIAPALIK